MKSVRAIAWTIAILLIYVVGIRWFLLDLLYDQGRLSGFGGFIESFNSAAGIGFGKGFHPLEEYRQRVDIFLFQLVSAVLLVRAILFCLKSRERLILLVVNLVGFGICFALVEAFLRSDEMQRRLGGSQYVQLDYEISASHIEKANSLGFTDIERSLQAGSNKYRIAVLGDSFVWGDGLADWNKIWSHQLEYKLRDQFGEDIEVLSWGDRGWSTNNQLRFLDETGSSYEIDYLIIGFVSNDPHIRGVSMARRSFVWQKVVKRILPMFENLVSISTTSLNALLYSLPYFTHWGYDGWARALYTPENLAEYDKLLQRLKTFSTQQGIGLLVVNTPTLHDDTDDFVFDKITPMLEALEIDYVDVGPTIQQRFGHLSPVEARAQLWANPADSHPGATLHSIYADEVFSFILDSNIRTDIDSRISGTD